MDDDDKITCNHCQKRCVPRLWTYSPFPAQLRYARTQHCCPFCGNVMYETGGRFKLWGLFALFCMGLLALGIWFEIYAPNFNASFVLGLLFEIGFWAVVLRFIYQFIQKGRRR